MDKNTLQKIAELLNSQVDAQADILSGLYESNVWGYEDLEYERGKVAGFRQARDLVITLITGKE